MNYILKPSLERIALVKVSVVLWNQDDIRDLMTKFCITLRTKELRYEGVKEEWQHIEDRVIEKVTQLPLPELLKEKTIGFIKPIGIQLLKLIEYHHDDPYLGIDLPVQVYWTPQGTIDGMKTAKVLIKDECIDVITRYKLACIYCLEEDILVLWKKMPENIKESFYSEECPVYVKQQELVVFWTYNIKGEVTKLNNIIEKRLDYLCSPYQYAFECAADNGNKVATEYFLEKLTVSEKKNTLTKAAGCVAYQHLNPYKKHSPILREYYSDILSILLSQMDEDQQIEVFKKFSCQVLMCLLDWPYNFFFMETASYVWKFLPETVYACLLMRILRKFVDGYKDFNYQKLLGENWQQSPTAYKRYVLNGEEIYCFGLIRELFKIKDEGNIKLIFQDATLAEKKKILYSYYGQDICEDLIDSEKWSLLEYFMEECISSKKEMMKFKRDFHYYIIRGSSKDEFQKRKDKWDTFLRLLNDLICNFDKRKCVEEDSEAKRICSRGFRKYK